MSLALFYLVLIIGAEVATNVFHLAQGIVFHGVILTGLLIHASRTANPSSRNLLLVLCLAPLTRIMSLSMPLTGFPVVFWYLIIYPPLFLAAWLIGKHLKYTAKEIGLNLQKLRLQFGIALTGLVFGVAEYYILKPEPLIPELTWVKMLLPAFVLVVCTGFVEEFMFRGVIQKASMNALGGWGLIYTALLFASLHLIHFSSNPWDIAFVFAVGLFYGWAVNKTGSLLGVTLSHGITNITLYLMMPFLFSSIPQLSSWFV
jgi:uncharacterized protein